MHRKTKSNWQTITFAAATTLIIFATSALAFRHANPKVLPGQPKPDFSAMEQWYEIVKYEYGDAASGDNKLYIIVKAKAEKRPRGGWSVQFRDKDGMLVRPNDSRYGNGLSGPSALTPVGEPEKIYCYTPGESDMERVVSATVVRIKE